MFHFFFTFLINCLNILSLELSAVSRVSSFLRSKSTPIHFQLSNMKIASITPLLLFLLLFFTTTSIYSLVNSFSLDLSIYTRPKQKRLKMRRKSSGRHCELSRNHPPLPSHWSRSSSTRNKSSFKNNRLEYVLNVRIKNMSLLLL